MGSQVCMGALLKCSFGLAPSSLAVLPDKAVMTGNKRVAVITDNKPLVNILPFGMCSSLTNPVVIAAMAAKLGVFTPMPCIPMTIAPWMPGSPTVMVGNIRALQNSSKLICLWAGVIQIIVPGQFTHMVP